mgnify:CR=1 FL=1
MFTTISCSTLIGVEHPSGITMYDFFPETSHCKVISPLNIVPNEDMNTMLFIGFFCKYTRFVFTNKIYFYILAAKTIAHMAVIMNAAR